VLAVLTVGFGLYAASVSSASAEREATGANSISPHELSRSTDLMDMKARPVPKFNYQTFVFSK
jgi:hypothetical protein